MNSFIKTFLYFSLKDIKESLRCGYLFAFLENQKFQGFQRVWSVYTEPLTPYKWLWFSKNGTNASNEKVINHSDFEQNTSNLSIGIK